MATKIVHEKDDNVLFFENLAIFDFFKFKDKTFMKIGFTPTDNALCVDNEIIYTVDRYDEVSELDVTITFEN